MPEVLGAAACRGARAKVQTHFYHQALSQILLQTAAKGKKRQEGIPMIPLCLYAFLPSYLTGCSARILPVRMKSIIWLRSVSLDAVKTRPPASLTGLKTLASTSKAMK